MNDKPGPFYFKGLLNFLNQSDMAAGRDELDKEGQKLWDAMMSDPNVNYMSAIDVNLLDEMMDFAEAKAKKTRTIPPEIYERAVVQGIRLAIKVLQQNSREVVAQCTDLQEQYTKKEEYFKANEARVAKICHLRFIERLQNILDGKIDINNLLTVRGEGLHIR